MDINIGNFKYSKKRNVGDVRTAEEKMNYFLNSIDGRRAEMTAKRKEIMESPSFKKSAEVAKLAPPYDKITKEDLKLVEDRYIRKSLKEKHQL